MEFATELRDGLRDLDSTEQRVHSANAERSNFTSAQAGERREPNEETERWMLRWRSELRLWWVRDLKREPQYFLVSEEHHLLTPSARDAKTVSGVASDRVGTERLTEDHAKDLAGLADGAGREPFLEERVDECLQSRYLIDAIGRSPNTGITWLPRADS